jgi:hypothetical protein
VTDPGAVDRLRTARRRANIDRYHSAHVAKGRPAVDCPSCEAHPPTRHRVGHGLYPLATRRALIKHLYEMHGRRDDMLNPDRHPDAELIAWHEKDHEL